MENKEIITAIKTGKAKFIGESEWEKYGAYQVYEYENKYYSIVVYDQQSCWLMIESLQEIKKEEINQYI